MKLMRVVTIVLFAISLISSIPTIAQDDPCAGILPTQFFPDQFVYVAEEGWHVYAQPSINAPEILPLSLDTELHLEWSDPVCVDGYLWRQISVIGQDVFGWVVEATANEYLLTPSQSCENPLVLGTPARLTVYNATIYEQPVFSATQLAEIEQDQTFDVMDDMMCSGYGAWVTVEFEDIQGWILAVQSDGSEYGGVRPVGQSLLQPLPTATWDAGQNPLEQSPNTLRELSPNTISSENIADLETIQILGDGQLVDAVWSPDSASIAVAGSADVRIYAINQLESPPQLLKEIGAFTQNLLYNANGSLLFTASRDGAVRIWDTDTWALLSTIETEPTNNIDIALSEDAHSLAIVSNNNLTIWDIQDVFTPTRSHTTQIICNSRCEIAFLSDTEVMVVGRSQIEIFNISTAEIRVPVNYEFNIVIADWTLDATRSHILIFREEMIGDITQSFFYRVEEFDLQTSERMSRFSYNFTQPANAPINTLGGLTYLTESSGFSININGAPQILSGERFFTPLEGLNINADAVALNADQSLLAVSTADGEILLIDGQTYAEVGVLTGMSGGIRDLSFSPNSAFIRSTGTDGNMSVWEVASQTLLGKVAFVGTGTNFALNLDETILISNLRQWNVQTGELLGDIINPLPEEPRQVFYDVNGTLLGIFPTPEGNLSMREMASGTERFTIMSNRLAISPMGDTIAYNDAESILVFDVLSGELLQTFSPIYTEFWFYDYSPDGNFIVVLQDGGDTALEESFLLWQVESGALIVNIPFINYWRGFALTRNNQILASVERGENRDVLESLVRITDLLDQTERVESLGAILTDRVYFSPDGSLFVALDRNNILIYDTTTWELIRTLSGHTNTVTQLRFSADGAFMVTASSDQTIRMWGITD